jgi:hypothetical protein
MLYAPDPAIDTLPVPPTRLELTIVITVRACRAAHKHTGSHHPLFGVIWRFAGGGAYIGVPVAGAVWNPLVGGSGCLEGASAANAWQGRFLAEVLAFSSGWIPGKIGSGFDSQRCPVQIASAVRSHVYG